MMSLSAETCSTESPGSKGPRPYEGLIVAETYRVVRRIGSGAMGDIYRAEHLRLPRSVAIKFLRAELVDLDRSLERFQHEARALASLRSDHIVSVIDCGNLGDGVPYLVTELLEGEDLRALLDRSGPLPIRRALGIALDVGLGLSAVHAAGLVHRDLKPANVFLTRDANRKESAKILDFGIAKSGSQAVTQHGALLGTVGYMAPEQLVDSAAVDARADIYGMAAILYECLTGQPPHTGSSVPELMFSVLNRDPKRAIDLRRALPPALSDVIATALARDVSVRYSSAPAFCSALRSALLSEPRAPARSATLSDATEPGSSLVHVPARAPTSWRSVALALLCGAVLGALLHARWFARSATRVATAPAIASAPCAAPTPMRGASDPDAFGSLAQPDAEPTRSPLRTKATAQSPRSGRDAPAALFDRKSPYAH